MLGVLPYSESFLEPFMPADVLKLHYTAHHGGAVNTANKATGLINKALESGNFEGVDYWTKNCRYTYQAMFCILFFGQILLIKNLNQRVNY